MTTFEKIQSAYSRSPEKLLYTVKSVVFKMQMFERFNCNLNFYIGFEEGDLQYVTTEV